ncbi:MAG: hypothetical protein K0U74_00250 [Alphaproteobacteria bacterium]|nr:hypothetical protein [Alphaproteobacteria bacterium]
MFIHLLTTFAMGAIGALIVYVVARTIGTKAPGVAYPVAIAVGMLSYSIYDEYSWLDRAASAMPTRFTLVRTYATSMPYQPWTYLIPRTYKFDALDLRSPRSNPAAPKMLLVQLLRVTRNTSSTTINAIVDCAKNRFTEVNAKTKFAETGLPINATWDRLCEHKALSDAVCGETKTRAKVE